MTNLRAGVVFETAPERIGERCRKRTPSSATPSCRGRSGGTRTDLSGAREFSERLTIHSELGVGTSNDRRLCDQMIGHPESCNGSPVYSAERC